MAFKQYTSCSSPANHITLGWGAYTYATLFIGLIVAGVASALNIYTLTILIGVDIMLIAFCIWWLYNRLVCLKSDDECAIGVVLTRGNPDPLGKAGDDDSTMNVLLAPGPTDTKQPKKTYWDNPVQGYLVAENQDILAIGLNYAQDGSDLDHVKALHCEFEGSGIQDVLEWASILLALLIAALAALFIPVIGPVLSVILWILAALFTGGAGFAALFDPLDPGDPADVRPNLGKLKDGDIVVVKGNWIYDSLHVGWNEIHAIHDCQIMAEINVETDGTWTWPLGLDDPTIARQFHDAWCAGLTEANTVQIEGSFSDPANNWVIHPLVDGCKPPVVIV